MPTISLGSAFEQYSVNGQVCVSSCSVSSLAIETININSSQSSVTQQSTNETTIFGKPWARQEHPKGCSIIGVSSLTKETINVNNSQSAAAQQSTNRTAGFHSEEWTCYSTIIIEISITNFAQKPDNFN
ncbi:hypothetical protein PPL_10449 [Heterostelium album PN500]|uniref:Uncharacterized protein n=1 Tax=Heterostelium pallidum (strain ATCC 26659 / Pp 5 / PN500) TaxID=670386 RepID=D3BR45_HETP5|nr:hypothetical protein PPL_10449 [Heterostelium album PN500]EFA75877.1 hypothetical protein PPL_10449 [Heterostelium album PN500]|eukprot:XP_020428011.1 hypothetical protein PPL_10449 [Heterostelium album PN500]